MYSGSRLTQGRYDDNEVILGKWFAADKDKRNDIFVGTKFSNDQKTFQVVSSPEYAKKACNACLERLGLRQIDLYYCHRVDGKTNREDLEAMVQLKNEGKIKYLGLSEIRLTHCAALTLYIPSLLCKSSIHLSHLNSRAGRPTSSQRAENCALHRLLSPVP
jgi:aryl-alcohol dehydrogenase-like predicted oxidoreductase